MSNSRPGSTPPGPPAPSAPRAVAVRSIGVTILVVLLLVIPAVPALAHATLLQTTPGDSSVVGSSPAEVTLRFDQPVSTAAGAVKVLSPDGSRVDTGAVTLRDGNRTVAESLHGDLDPGTYTVLWRVISADTHTVFGAETFSVKTASTTTGAQAAEAEQASAGKAADDLLDVSRLVFYLGLLLLLGALAFLAFLWPGGFAFRRTRRLLWGTWSLAVLGTVGGLLMQGPYSEGLGLYYTFDPQLIAQVLPTRFGVISMARLALLLVMAGAIWGIGRIRARVIGVVAGVIGVGLLITTSAIGHAGTGDLAGFAFPADVFHLAAAGAWLGGLVVLAVGLLRQPQAELADILPRWSRYAELSVLVLVVTGTFAGWRQVREWGALTHTNYGILLLVKVGLVLVILALGAWGRSQVRRHFRTPLPHASGRGSGPSPSGSTSERLEAGFLLGGGSVATRTAATVTAEVRTIDRPDVARVLRRSVIAEAVIAVVVLGVTAVLVSTTPAEESYFPVFEQTRSVTDDLRVQVQVGPARAGLDDMHFTYSDSSGNPVDVTVVTARWTLQGGENVVPVQLKRSSTGHYDREQVELSTVGTWQLAVTTQTSDVDSWTTLFTVRIR